MKKNSKISKTIFITLIIAISFFIFSQNEIRAAEETSKTSSDTYTVLAPLPCIESGPTTYVDSNGNTQTNPGITCPGGNGSLQTKVDFKTYIQYMMNLLIALSSATAVVMLIWGGIEYMWSEQLSNKKMGLERAKNAIYGLLLILSSYLILRTIDPRLVEIPNTLVPKLTINKKLSQDITKTLIEETQKEIEAYNSNSIELNNAIIKAAQDKKSLRTELEEIDKQLSSLPESEKEKRAELQLKKAKIQDEMTKIQASVHTDAAKSAFNLVLSIYLDENTYDNPNDAKSVLKKIDEGKKQIDSYKNIAKDRLGNFGGGYFEEINAKIKEIDSEATYSKGILDTKKLDTTLKTINVYNYLGKRYFSILDLNGEKKQFNNSAEVKKYLGEEIANIKSQTGSTNNQQLTEDFNKKISDLNYKIDTNLILKR